MAVKTFLKWPDKGLRTRARDIAEITDDINLIWDDMIDTCLLYTSPSPRDLYRSRMPSSA